MPDQEANENRYIGDKPNYSNKASGLPKEKEDASSKLAAIQDTLIDSSQKIQDDTVKANRIITQSPSDLEKSGNASDAQEKVNQQPIASVSKEFNNDLNLQPQSVKSPNATAQEVEFNQETGNSEELGYLKAEEIPLELSKREIEGTIQAESSSFQAKSSLESKPSTTAITSSSVSTAKRSSLKELGEKIAQLNKKVEEKSVENRNVQVNPQLTDEVFAKSLFANLPLKTPQTRHRENQPNKKADYGSLNEVRCSIGEMGEAYAMKWEKLKLSAQGLENFVDKVNQVSITDDSKGYDIESYSWPGVRKFIEVKATTAGRFEPFYLSRNELNAMRTLPNYFIYRVFNLNIKTGEGQIYVLDCSKDIDTYFKMEPLHYRFSPKR